MIKNDKRTLNNILAQCLLNLLRLYGVGVGRRQHSNPILVVFQRSVVWSAQMQLVALMIDNEKAHL